jgi:hypothetical protein
VLAEDGTTVHARSRDPEAWSQLRRRAPFGAARARGEAADPLRGRAHSAPEDHGDDAVRGAGSSRDAGPGRLGSWASTWRSSSVSTSSSTA